VNSAEKLKISGLALLAACTLAIPGQSKEEGAKDLFYRQQANPASVLNNGLQYWIEVNRAGQVFKVSNKHAFKSGDKIRIHVKTNIDAFAYVLLREGSSGEQSVLFPDPRFHDNNRLKASSDCAVPQEGFLTFDQTPGTEKLILLISRQALQPEKYLSDKSKSRVTIAAVPSGAKDLVPGSVVLAYSDQDSSAPAKLTDKLPSSPQSQPRPPIKDELVADNNQQSVTTLVQTDPNQVLAVDLALLHEP
jgi:hypothetical protein